MPKVKAQTSQNNRPKRKWTVMVFMGEATIEGTAPLEHAADADLAEMAAIGSGNGLNIFVQRHGRGKPQRRHIEKDPGEMSRRNNKCLRMARQSDISSDGH